jgi:hypothetical protein
MRNLIVLWLDQRENYVGKEKISQLKLHFIFF